MATEIQEKQKWVEPPPVIVKRRRGILPSGRSDGRRVKSLPPLNNLMPYIMKRRVDSTNYFKSSVEIAAAEKYIRRKRVEGLKGFGMLHFFIAAYVRVVSQRPGINRFISGQRLYARHGIEINLAVKKDYSIGAQETTIKVLFSPSDTAEDVYYKIQRELEVAFRDGDSNETDNLARIFTHIPAFFLRITVRALEFMDYYGLIPRSLMLGSPFHGSLFVADLGSLMLPPVHHHLYHFGNIPLFLALGVKRKAFELDKNGAVQEHKYLDYALSLDERIVDGFYFAGVLRMVNEIFKRPDQLDLPPEAVVEDLP